MKQLISFTFLLVVHGTYAQTAGKYTIRFVEASDSVTPVVSIALEGFRDGARQYDWSTDAKGMVTIDPSEIDPAYAPTEYRTREDVWEKSVIFPAQLEKGKELIVYLEPAATRLMELGVQQSIGGVNKGKYVELEMTAQDMQRYRELLDGKMAIPEQTGKQVSLRDWQKAIVKELKYPKEIFFADVQGHLMLEFEMNEEGRVVFLKLKDPVHPALALEAVRVLTSAPPVNFVAGEGVDYPLKPGKRYLLPFRYVIVEAE